MRSDILAVLIGEKLFARIGCGACHMPNHILENGEETFSFTDLLLYDMGEGLADGIAVGNANYQEWRTPPLWGIGFSQIVSGHTYFLHDGWAWNLSEAIAWHGARGRHQGTNFCSCRLSKERVCWNLSIQSSDSRKKIAFC